MTPTAWDDIENNPTWHGTRDMQRIVTDVIAYSAAARIGDMTTALSHRRLAMFCSAPGLGKTHTLRMVKRAGLRVGDVSPSGKADICYQFWGRSREGCGLTVFDDKDLAVRSEPIIAVLKSAWQSSGEGNVITPGSHAIRKNEKYRVTADERYDPAVPPPSFSFTLGHLWYSNKPLHTAAGRAEHKCHQEFEALIDRGLKPIWIDSIARNVCFYTVYMILRENLFGDLGLSLIQGKETYDFFMDVAVAGQHPRPNLRLARDLAMARRRPDFKQAWEELVRDSRAEAPDEPKALTAEDFQGRPDFLAEMLAARERAAEAKRIADAALTEARRVEAVKADSRRRELAAIAAVDAEDRQQEREELAIHTVPEVVVLVQPERPKPEPYEPPPGHVLPPPVIGSPYPAPPPYYVQIIGDGGSAADPQPDPEPPPAPPEPEPDYRAIDQAIREIYTSGGARTCANVAEILRRLPIHDWDRDTREVVAEKLRNATHPAIWQDERCSLMELYFQHSPAILLFATDTDVLQFDDDEHGDLRIVPWTEIAELMAPKIAEQRKQNEKRRRQDELNAILHSKLPKVRKLKAMRERIERLHEIRFVAGIRAQQAITHILAMKTDDPNFADCVTFKQYIAATAKRLTTPATPKVGDGSPLAP